MSRAEETAYAYMRAARDGDNRVLKDFVRGRSKSWRKMILRQLKKWDCVQEFPISLLNAEPEPKREES